MKTVQILAGIFVVAMIRTVALGQSPSTAVAPHSPAAPAQSSKIEGLYSGKWVTTNRKLDGTMNSQVTQIAKDRWQGRFWGVWQQVPFDYTVEFARGTAPATGPTAAPQVSRDRDRPAARLVDVEADSRVTGTAMIDGASYVWNGILTPTEFNIVFTGSRYEGHAELKRVPDPISSPAGTR